MQVVNNPKRSSKNKNSLQIIPLGGLDGIGRNCQVIKYGSDVIVIDCGIMFPDETMPGIDKIIPDLTLIRELKHQIKGVILTHGHEDHIGALGYLYDEIDVPLYGTKLTLGLASNKLNYKQKKSVKKHIIQPRSPFRVGAFEIEFARVNHSIPDGVALIIKSPAGTIVHSGDFKVDYTPVDGNAIDLSRLAQAGDEGVMVFLSDSTNSQESGYTPSESSVGETFNNIFRQSQGRVIIATFASNIHRIQQAIDMAIFYGRQFTLMGKSMEENVLTAHKLGYIKYPEASRLSFDELQHLPDNKAAIITTGSQGEPMSALTRMSREEHRLLKVKPEDTVVISAVPIPGNEKQVVRTVDMLFRQGANVIYEADSDVHVSGHAKLEEQKLLLTLIKPQYFIPVHGEYRHLKYHAMTAESLGIPKENIFVADNGDILEFSKQQGRLVGKTKGAGIMIDGLGRHEADAGILGDRRILGREGVISVTVAISKSKRRLMQEPIIKTRGFAYMKESAELLKTSQDKIITVINKLLEQQVTDLLSIRKDIQNRLKDFLYEQTHRRPIILAVVVEID